MREPVHGTSKSSRRLLNLVPFGTVMNGAKLRAFSIIEGAKNPDSFEKKGHEPFFYGEGLTPKQPRVAESARPPWVMRPTPAFVSAPKGRDVTDY
jgi:hypothetical protein